MTDIAVVGLAKGLGMRTIAEGVEDQGTLDVLVQTVALDGSGPAGVPAGSGGLVDQGGLPTSVLLATGLGVAVALSGGTVLARARRQQ